MTHNAFISTEDLETIFDVSPLAMCIISTNDVFLAVNSKFLEITGYKKEELINQKIDNLIIQNHFTIYNSQKNNLLKKQKGEFTIEKRIIKKDNSIIWVKNTIKLISKPERTYLLSIFDVIEDTKKKEAALTESTERLNLALKSWETGKLEVYTATWEWDITNNILYWDDYMFKMFEIDKEIFTNRYEDFASRVHSEDIDRVNKDVENSIKNQTDFQTDYRIILPNNNIRYILARGKPILDVMNSSKILTGVCWDVTYFKNIELSLQETNKKLKSLNEELCHLLYTASHDLQEPIRTIGSYIKWFEENYSSKCQSCETFQGKGKKYINYITNSCDKITSMIKDLLEYSNISSSSNEFEPYNIETLINETLTLLNYKIETNKAKINIANCNVTINCQKQQIQRVIQNLISNAIKFKSNNTPIVDIYCEDKGSHFQISVKDNGIGIEKLNNEKIFEMFTRYHSKNIEGNGMGLAICKKIVEKHEGNIWYTSEINKGSTFYFTINKFLKA